MAVVSAPNYKYKSDDRTLPDELDVEVSSSGSSLDSEDSPQEAKSSKSPLSAAEASTIEARRHEHRVKRYRRAASAASAAVGADGAPGTATAAASAGALAGQQKASPTKRRIMRKDRRATLEMLTSDDDVNEYQGTRPSPYMEPANRRNLHEVKPHLKSSFETLYNPELNQFANDDPELLYLSQSSSVESMDESPLNAVSQRNQTGKATEPWHLPRLKVVSPYLDVTQSTPYSNGHDDSQGMFDLPNTKQHELKPHAPEAHVDQVDSDKIGQPLLQKHTSGEIWTEFEGPEVQPTTPNEDTAKPAKPANDSEWIVSAKNQPLNLSIKLSTPNNPNSGTSKSPAIDVDLEIELDQRGTPTVANPKTAPVDPNQLVPIKKADDSTGAGAMPAAEDSSAPPSWAKLPAKLFLLPDKVSPRRSSPHPDTVDQSLSAVIASPTSPAVEKPRGRRVLPTVPDSADLEVSDLLRESQGTAAGDRPKSAVEILVSKTRSSSILQQQPTPSDDKPQVTVSQQLRSLFHNPSPLIMFQRAATRPTPQPLPTSSKAAENSDYLQQQQANRYLPLRAAPPRVDDNRRSVNGSVAATIQLESKPDAPRTLGSLQATLGTPQPPELPFRRNRSLLPNQRLQQEPPKPQSAVLAQPAMQPVPPPSPPPPVPPRQAKTTIARQQSPSTFYPNKVQLLGPASSAAPPVAARSLRKSAPTVTSERPSDNKGSSLSAVDQLYKRVQQQLPGQSGKHTVIVGKSLELNGSSGFGSSEYLLAGDASASDKHPISQQIPSRIQTNPHMGGRPRDSVPRRAEPANDHQVHIDAQPKLQLETPLRRAREGRHPEVESPATTLEKDSSDPKPGQPTYAFNPKRMEDSILRLSLLSQPKHSGGNAVPSQGTARDRLFSDSSKAERRPAAASSSQTVASRSAGNNSRQTTALNGGKRPPAKDDKLARMPPNAVRVLPTGDDSELRERMRALGNRSAGRSPRGFVDDAVAGLERMCRDMRLEDEGLLDGADRHDTPARVQTRMDALSVRESQQPPPPDSVRSPLSSSSSTDRPYFVQRRGIFPLNRETDDQAKRFQVDSNRKYSSSARSETHMRMVKEAGATNMYPNTARTLRQSASITSEEGAEQQQAQLAPKQQNHSVPVLQPGEREKGPEIIL